MNSWLRRGLWKVGLVDFMYELQPKFTKGLNVHVTHVKISFPAHVS